MGDWGGDPHLVLSICLGGAQGELGEKKKKKKPISFFVPPCPITYTFEQIFMPNTSNLK